MPEAPKAAVDHRADFQTMSEGNADDFAIIRGRLSQFARKLPERIMAHLRLLECDFGGFPVDGLEHSLQAATRAYRAGEDEEYVVCALLHDIGDFLCTQNHADLGAAVLKPFVSERHHWMLSHHAIFQGYYFFHHLGLDRHMREQFRGHPDFEFTARFCHLYDQNAFERDYDSMPLAAFEPMLHRVLAQPQQSIYGHSLVD
jgi:predicted HD phosphohydrolase